MLDALALIALTFLDLGEPAGRAGPRAFLDNPAVAARVVDPRPVDPEPTPDVPAAPVLPPSEPEKPSPPPAPAPTVWNYATDHAGVTWHDADRANLDRWVAYRNATVPAPLSRVQSYNPSQTLSCKPGTACYRGR